MRASSAQWGKEARQMAWPWAIVMGAGLLVLARPWFASLPDIPGVAGVWKHMADWILPIGTFFGSALLAVLPLGAEFQYRTLAMRLAQPIDREVLWRQKFLLTIAAVLPPAVIYCIAVLGHDGRAAAIATAAWIIVTIFGAIPATLLARSIIGGVVLNEVAGFGVTLGWMYYEKHHGFPAAAVWATGIGLVAYAGFMTWLGRRMLARYQAAEGMQAGEDFVPGERLVPAAVARWFDPRPKQPLRNLVRREFRLVRMLWLLIAIYTVAWVLIVAFHQLPNGRSGDEQVAALAFTIILGVIIAVLAGTLSLGEEKAWGTHDWHMTVPVSIGTQWAVKLLFAMATSVVFVALVPVAILTVGSWAGVPVNEFATGRVLDIAVLEAAAITLIGFWCACIVKGTIQSILWVFPVCFAIGISGQAGSWVLEPFDHSLRSGIAGVVGWMDPFAVGKTVSLLYRLVPFEDVMGVMIAALVAVGLIQSLRMFRAQVGANKLRIVRCALPLMLISFAWGAGSVVAFDLFSIAWRQQYKITMETDKAIGALQASGQGATARRATGDDLVKATKLSEETTRWLRGATITIADAPQAIGSGPGPYFPGRMMFIVRGEDLKGRTPYSAVVRDAHGRTCSMMLQIRRGQTDMFNVGYVTAVCD